jgi:hypothetical protein
MPNTTCFEDFEGFILTSLHEHLDTHRSSELAFLKTIRQTADNVIGEARRNHEEYLNSGKDSMRFFKTILGKLVSLEESIFDIVDDTILYKPDNIIFKIKTRESVEIIFLFHIYNAIKEIKRCFEEFLPFPLEEYQFQTSLIKES